MLLKAAVAVIPFLLLEGCNQKVKADRRIDELSPPDVEHKPGFGLVEIDHPELFPLAIAVAHSTASDLNVTGTVNADISRNVPVVSLASGRVVEIHARLGDEVTKGQLMIRIQSADISGVFSDYRKASADEGLARVQLDRAKLLYSRGAIAKKELEVAQEIDDKAKV